MTNQGLVLGNDCFKDQVEVNLAQQTRRGKVGWPRSQEMASEADSGQLKVLVCPRDSAMTCFFELVYGCCHWSGRAL